MKLLNVFLIVLFFVIVALIPWYGMSYFKDSFLIRLDQAGILLGYFLSCLSVALGSFAWLKRKDIKKWMTRKKFASVGAPFDVPEEFVEAMVIPVSPRREQPEWILRWLKPKHVSFLYTDKSKLVAQKLVDEFSKAPHSIDFYPNAKDIGSGKHMIETPDKPEVSKSQVQYFINRFIEKSIPVANIFVDTTAGTVPMSIGAFQTAEETGASSIYIVGTKDRKIENPKIRAHGDPKFMSDHTN